MRNVSVSDLKAHLSRYLREVRRGGEVQILDRGVPVARLTGLGGRVEERGEHRRDRLVRAGILRPGTGDATPVLGLPPIEVAAAIGAALEADREDRL